MYRNVSNKKFDVRVVELSEIPKKGVEQKIREGKQRF